MIHKELLMHFIAYNLVRAVMLQAALERELLRLIAFDQLPPRPGRVEPRAKKRRPKNYQLLTKPRHKMKLTQRRNRHKAPLT
jgi:hypothetical protein